MYFLDFWTLTMVALLSARFPGSQETQSSLDIWHENHSSHIYHVIRKRTRHRRKRGWRVQCVIWSNSSWVSCADLLQTSSQITTKGSILTENTFLNDKVSLKLTHVLIIHLLSSKTVFKQQNSLFKQNMIKWMRSSGWREGGQGSAQVESSALASVQLGLQQHVNQPSIAASGSHKKCH